MKSIYLTALVLIANFFFASGLSAQTVEVEPHEELESLLAPERFVFANAGLTEVDYEQVRKTLLAAAETIHLYPDSKQAYYWLRLAVSGYQLRLNSDYVMPLLGKAVSISESLSVDQHAKILRQSIELAMKYEHYREAIAYLDQIFALDVRHTDLQLSRPHREAKKLYAVAHYHLGQYEQAEYYFESLIKDIQTAGEKPDQGLFHHLASLHLKNKNQEKAIQVRKRLVALYPTKRNMRELGWLDSNHDYVEVMATWRCEKTWSDKFVCIAV